MAGWLAGYVLFVGLPVVVCEQRRRLNRTSVGFQPARPRSERLGTFSGEALRERLRP